MNAGNIFEVPGWKELFQDLKNIEWSEYPPPSNVITEQKIGSLQVRMPRYSTISEMPIMAFGYIEELSTCVFKFSNRKYAWYPIRNPYSNSGPERSVICRESDVNHDKCRFNHRNEDGTKMCLPTQVDFDFLYNMPTINGSNLGKFELNVNRLLYTILHIPAVMDLNNWFN